MQTSDVHSDSSQAGGQEVPTQEAAGLRFTGAAAAEFPHPGRSKIPPSCDLSLADARPSRVSLPGTVHVLAVGENSLNSG